MLHNFNYYFVFYFHYHLQFTQSFCQTKLSFIWKIVYIDDDEFYLHTDIINSRCTLSSNSPVCILMASLRTANIQEKCKCIFSIELNSTREHKTILWVGGMRNWGGIYSKKKVCVLEAIRLYMTTILWFFVFSTHTRKVYGGLVWWNIKE